jgi:hypothetical protein
MMKMDLNLSEINVLNSTYSLASLNQSASILSVLMTRQGWRDPGQAVSEAESKAQDKQWRLKMAFENYTSHPDSHRANQLLTLLHEVETDLESEYQYAIKQQTIYEMRAKQEAKSGSGFISDWTQWLWQGVQDFFGSSSQVLAEKYAQMATARQRELAELNKWLSVLQQELLADSTSLLESEIKVPQRRLLQQPGSQITVQNPPNQSISVGHSYSYFLNEVFSGDYTVLSVTQTNQSSLPDWLNFQYQLIGSYPNGLGTTWGVEVSGNTLFVADRAAGLLILDVSIPRTPRLLGNYSVHSGRGALNVAVSGGRAFVTTDPGLLILDISVPSAPQLLGNYTAPSSGTVYDLAVSGNTVFLADEAGGILILDVSIPAMPQLLGNYTAGSGLAGSVAVSGNTLFVADEPGGLLILDVSIPKTPRLLGNYSAGIGHSDGLAVSGNTVYVADYTGGLLILDVSVPSMPRLLGSYPAGLGAAYRVEVLGNTAFVANRAGGLLVLDVSTPQMPRLLGSYPSDVYDVAVSGGIIFLANAVQGVLVLDLTQGQLWGFLSNAIDGKLSITVSAHNETNTLATAQFTLQNSFPEQVINVGQPYLYSLNTIFSGDYSILGATATNQLSLPDWLSLQYQLLGTFYAGNSGVLGPFRIKIFNHTAFLAGSDSFLVVDLSTPHTPKAVGNYTPNSGLDYGVALRNDTAFVTVDSGLLILDFSTGTPQLVGNYDYTGGLGYEVAVSGNTVFVSDGAAKVLILDVTTLSAPRLLTKFTAGPGNVYGLTVSGNNLFISHDSASLLIFDVSKPSMPRQIGNYTVSSGYSEDVAVSGNIVYLVSGDGGLQILNMSVPSMLQLLGNYSGLAFNKVLILDNILYVTSYKSGLLVFDVNTPGKPQLLGGYSIPSNYVFEVAVLGNIAYIVTGEGGLLLIDLAQGQLTGIPPNSVGEQFSITVSARDFTSILAIGEYTLTLDDLPSHTQYTISDQSLFPGNSLSLSLDSQSLFVNPTQSFLKLSLSMDAQELPSWLQLTLIPNLVATYPAGSGLAHSIAVSGNTVFIADEYIDLQVIDVSIPTMPKLVSQYLSQSGSGYEVAVSNNLLFLADTNAVLIFNISTPNTPQLVGNYSVSALGLTVSGNTLYVVDSNISLLIVDINELRVPRLLGKYIGDSSGQTYGVAVSGNTVYVADYNDGLLIVDVSMPDAPQLLGNYDKAGDVVYDVKVSAFDNNIIFVADGNVGLLTLDASAPNTPLLLSTYPVGSVGYAIDLEVRGSTVFVADYHGGVLILDTNMPNIPQLMGAYPSKSGDTDAITVSGNTIYVANDVAGLLILGTSQWQLTANPQAGDARNYAIRLTATDELGGSVSILFTIRVEGPPQVNGRIPLQYAPVGQTFNYFVPQGFFTDPNFDSISFNAHQSNGDSLPSWLSFNSVSATLAGVPQEGGQGTMNLTISGTDHIAGITNTTFLLFIGDPIPQPPTLREGRMFNFSVSPATFAVADGLTRQYRAIQSNGKPSPGWLLFDSSTLEFSGIPPVNGSSLLNLNVIAQDSHNDTISAPLSFVITTNFPLQINPISDQSATVGDSFNFFVPPNTFLNENDYALTYTALQKDGSVLPHWLSFDNKVSTPLFSGTPGHSDTDFYAIRQLDIQLNAFDGVVNATTLFRINVGGTSWGELAIKIIAPLLSGLTTLYTLYQLRALFLNRCFKGRYQKEAKNYVTKDFVAAGDNFQLVLKTAPELIERVTVRLPTKQTRSRGQQFFQLPRALPGGVAMPDWMKYDPFTNILSTKEPIPASVGGQTLVIQVSGEMGVILEQFDLAILPGRQNLLLEGEMADEKQSSVELENLIPHPQILDPVPEEVELSKPRILSPSIAPPSPKSRSSRAHLLGEDSPLVRNVDRTSTSANPPDLNKTLN